MSVALGLRRDQDWLGATAWGMYVHATVPVPTLVALAQEAERLGAAVIVVPDEGIDRDVYVTLAAVAAATSRIVLATGITNPHSRHPVATAAAFASLAELAPDRIIVGLGTGGSMVFGPMGFAPARPYTSLVETVDVVQALLDNERVWHEGEVTAAGAHLGWSPGRLPLAIAGRGPRVEQLAIDRADWLLSAGRPAATVPELVARMRHGGGRPAKLAWGTMTAWSQRGVETLRPYFAFITTNTPRGELNEIGVSDDVVDAIQDAFATGGLEAAAPLVPDRLIEHYAVVDDAAGVARRLGEAARSFSPELVLIEAVEPTVEYVGQMARVAADAGFAPVG